MKLTKKIIIEAVKKASGIDDVDLVKFDGDYYWEGKPSCLFDTANTYYDQLNHPNVSLQAWVDDYLDKVKTYEQFSDKTIMEVVDGIDWNVDES
jgi:hypothetical protein